MSAYDNDPRVTGPNGGPYDLAMPTSAGSITETVGSVELQDDGLWRSWVSVGTVASRDLLGTRGWGDQFHDTADEAIRSLIGDPQ